MPGPWRDKFVNAGKVVSDLTIAEHMRYFRQQESFRFESNTTMHNHTAAMSQNVIHHQDCLYKPMAARRQKSVLQ
jgi:hypothetical protein